MADREQVDKLEKACVAIAELAPRKLDFVRRDQWGEITFERIENDIDTAFWLVEEIRELPTSIVPDDVLQNTTTYLTNMRNIFSEIDAFSISRGDASSLRDNIENRLKHEIQSTMSIIGIWLPVLALRAGKIENWAVRMKDISAEMTKILQETTEHSELRKKEIDDAAQAARAAAGEAGAAEFTHEFREESQSVEARARDWLWPTGIFAGLALSLSGLLMFGLLGEAPANTWEALYRLGGRLIAISVLFYAAVWSGRIVLANMHLASVNKHRAVSLQTLQAFHQATEDAAAKDAVVLEAARAVYENVPSGYIGRQSSEHSASARIVEIIKDVNKTGQGDQ